MNESTSMKHVSGDSKSGDPLKPCQSLWMAHWMQSSCVPKSFSGESSTSSGGKEDENPSSRQGPSSAQIPETSQTAVSVSVDVGLDDSPELRNSKRFKGVLEATSGVLHPSGQVASEAKEIKMKNVMLTRQETAPAGVEVTDLKCLTISKASESPFDGKKLTRLFPQTDVTISKSYLTRLRGAGSSESTDNVLSRSDECFLQAKGTKQLVIEPHLAAEKGHLLTARSLQDRFPGSTSISLFPSFDSEKPDANSALREDGDHVHCFQLKNDNYAYQRGSTYIASNTERKRRFSSTVPLTRKVHGFFPCLQDDRGNQLSTGVLHEIQSSTPGLAQIGDSNCNHESLQILPGYSLQNVETLQICTTMDSVDGTSGGPPKFSKTIHHMLLTQKTGVNISGEKDGMAKDLAVSSESGRNQPSIFHLNTNQEQSHTVWGPAGSDDENRADMRVQLMDSDNESSAETDAMPIDSLSVKDITGHQNAATDALLGNAAELRCLSGLPHRNKELLTSLAPGKSMDKRALSTSRTESLDVENFLSQMKQQPESCSPREETPPELCSLWVKRLRPAASESLTFGSKKWRIGDEYHTENKNKLFRKIMHYRRTNSASRVGDHLSQEILEETSMLPRNREPFSLESVKQRSDVNVLSNFWIQRLLHKQETSQQRKRPSLQVTCEPLSSKVAFDEGFQRKQFPSLAAMALMGKALVNFQPCEFRRRGSSVVWNR